MTQGKALKPRFDGLTFYPSAEKDIFSFAGGTDENGISSEHRRYRDEFKKLLGTMVPALLRDGGGALDVRKIKVQDFAEFKKFLQRQAELNDGKSFQDPCRDLLEDENFEPLLKLLYQEIDPDFYTVISVTETEALFKEFQAKLIEIDASVFVRHQYNSKEGRDNIRHVLGDASAFTKDQRSEVLKAVARAAEEEETLWFGGSQGLKLSDHISLFNYFNWGVGDREIANATDVAQDYLKAADERDQERALQEEQYSKNPEEVRGVRYLKEALGYQISKAEIQDMAHLAKSGLKDPDPRKQVQGHLAELWLLAVDTRRFGKNTEEAYGINAYIIEKTESLIEASKEIQSDEDLEAFNEKLQEFLNGPIATLEKGQALRWLKHQTLGLGLKEQFENYPADTRRPYEQLLQFSDKWKYALDCGEKILLDTPRKEAVDPKVEGAKNQLIVGLQKTQQELWYNYKQHKALSRGMSQTANLLNPQYTLAKWIAPDQAQHLAVGDYAEIDAANIELGKLIANLQKATTKEEVEAQLERLNELIKADGILYEAFQAAEMDGTEQVIGLVQTVAIILGTAQVTRGASLAVEGTEALFLADKMLRGFFWGAYMATAENTIATTTGEVRTERDTLGNWTKDALSTGTAMALVMPATGSLGQVLEGNALKNLAARYLKPGGLVRLAGDTGLETIEETVDQQLRKTLDGKSNALSPSEIKELFKLCLAGGGLQIGAVAKNFQGQVEAKALEKAGEDEASKPRKNPLLNPVFAPMWAMLGVSGLGGSGKGDEDGGPYRSLPPAGSEQRIDALDPKKARLAAMESHLAQVLRLKPDDERRVSTALWLLKLAKEAPFSLRWFDTLVPRRSKGLDSVLIEVLAKDPSNKTPDAEILGPFALVKALELIVGSSLTPEQRIDCLEAFDLLQEKLSRQLALAKLNFYLMAGGSLASILAMPEVALMFLPNILARYHFVATYLLGGWAWLKMVTEQYPIQKKFWDERESAFSGWALEKRRSIENKSFDPRFRVPDAAPSHNATEDLELKARVEAEAIEADSELSEKVNKAKIEGPFGFFLTAGAGLATLLGASEAQAAATEASHAIGSGELFALGNGLAAFALGGIFHWLAKRLQGLRSVYSTSPASEEGSHAVDLEVKNLMSRLATCFSEEKIGLRATLVALGGDAVPALTGFLNHENWQVRMEAVMALASLRARETADHLRKLLKDPDGFVRAQAAVTLAEWGQIRAVEDVRVLLDDSSDLVKHMGIETVVKFGIRDALPELWRLAEDPKGVAGHLAIDALEKMGELRTVEALRRLKVEPNTWSSPLFAEVLAKLGGVEELDLFRRFLQDKDPAVRETVLWGLLNIDSEEILGDLIALLKDKNPNVRLLAERKIKVLCGLPSPKADPKLNAVAAPAILGLDMLLHGQPTPLGLAAAAASMAVMGGFFSRFRKNEEPEDSVTEFGSDPGPFYFRLNWNQEGGAYRQSANLKPADVEILSSYENGAPKGLVLRSAQILGQELPEGTLLLFTSSGRLFSVTLMQPANVLGMNLGSGDRLHLDGAGNLETLVLHQDRILQGYAIAKGFPVTFYPNGRLRSFMKMEGIKKKTSMTLSENGRVAGRAWRFPAAGFARDLASNVWAHKERSLVVLVAVALANRIGYFDPLYQRILITMATLAVLAISDHKSQRAPKPRAKRASASQAKPKIRIQAKAAPENPDIEVPAVEEAQAEEETERAQSKQVKKGDKLYASAAPALLGLDMLMNGQPTLAGLLVTGIAAAGGIVGMVRLVHSRKSLLNRPGPAESIEGRSIDEGEINTATLFDSFKIDAEKGSPRVPVKIALEEDSPHRAYSSDHLSSASLDGALEVFEDIFREKRAAERFPARKIFPNDNGRILPATENQWSIAYLRNDLFTLRKNSADSEKIVLFRKSVEGAYPQLTIQEARLQKDSKFVARQVVNFLEPDKPRTKTYQFSWIGDQAITAICAQLGLPAQGRENLLRGLAEFVFDSGPYTPEELEGPLQNETDSPNGDLYREFKAEFIGVEEDPFFRIWHSPSALAIMTHEVDPHEKEHSLRLIFEQGGIERFDETMPLGQSWMNFLSPFLAGNWR